MWGSTSTFAYHIRVEIDAMQMDIHKTLRSFYTTKKMRHVTATVTKCASLAEIDRYIMKICSYTIGYLQISKAE